MRAMITNGGPHPADKWAETTTESILDLIQIADDSTSPEAAAARTAKRDLRPVLFGIFNGHHDKVQKHERGHLAKNVKEAADAAALATDTLDVTQHLSVMDEVRAAFAATPFAAHFAKPEVVGVVKQIVGSHTADVMHIERRYHSERLNKGA